MTYINQPAPTIEYIILGLLSSQPAHGYDLHKRIQALEDLSEIWRVKRSKLYYLLEKLEEKELLDSTQIPVENRPDRRQYHLTKKGRDAFRSWTAAPVEKARNVRLVFLARLYFSLRIGEERALNLIAKQRALCQTWIDSLQGQLNDIENPGYITQQAFNFRIGQIQAMLIWLDECQKQLPP